MSNSNSNPPNNGWVKIHRNIMKWEWYGDHNTTRLFLHLLFKANHADNEWKGIRIRAGSLVTGRKALALETGLSEQQIRSSLIKLKSTQEVTIKPTNKFSIITLCNWGYYQTDEKKVTNKNANEQPTNNQQITTNKNDKNVKNTPLTPQGGNEEALKNVEERPSDKALQPEPIKAPRARARSQATAVQEDITAPLRTTTSPMARAVVTKATTGVGVSKKTRASLLEWVDYLTDHGKRINAQSIRKFVEVKGNNEHRITTTIDNSICNGYKSLVEPKKLTGATGKVKEKPKFVMSKEAQALQNF